MKAYVPLLCLTISTAPCFAETKQSAPLSIQPGTTMLTLNKMCQENANTRPYAVCMAYLRGLFDGMQQAKIVEESEPDPRLRNARPPGKPTHPAGWARKT